MRIAHIFVSCLRLRRCYCLRCRSRRHHTALSPKLVLKELTFEIQPKFIQKACVFEWRPYSINNDKMNKKTLLKFWSGKVISTAKWIDHVTIEIVDEIQFVNEMHCIDIKSNQLINTNWYRPNNFLKSAMSFDLSRRMPMCIEEKNTTHRSLKNLSADRVFWFLSTLSGFCPRFWLKQGKKRFTFP